MDKSSTWATWLRWYGSFVSIVMGLGGFTVRDYIPGIPLWLPVVLLAGPLTYWSLTWAWSFLRRFAGSPGSRWQEGLILAPPVTAETTADATEPEPVKLQSITDYTIVIPARPYRSSSYQHVPFGFRWRWDGHTIESLAFHCPKCGIKLNVDTRVSSFRSRITRLDCPRCGYGAEIDAPTEVVLQRVRAHIYQELRSQGLL